MVATNPQCLVRKYAIKQITAFEIECPRCGHLMASVRNNQVGYASCSKCRSHLRLPDELKRIQIQALNAGLTKG
jgi:hypothetical protein